MKKNFLTCILLGITFMAQSQNASVEQSTFGIQTGPIGIWVYNEAKLSNQFAFRAEVGMEDLILIGNAFAGVFAYLITPTITLEPRWYYNLNKRVSKSKNISGNSGNFLTIKAKYNPNWVVLSNLGNIQFPDIVSIIPTWGIKRNIGKHFTYETGIGVGYIYFFTKEIGSLKNLEGVVTNLHLRIGYRF